MGVVEMYVCGGRQEVQVEEEMSGFSVLRLHHPSWG